MKTTQNEHVHTGEIQVTFEKPEDFQDSPSNCAQIEAILRRLEIEAVLKAHPDELVVKKRLAGGFSGTLVLDVAVKNTGRETDRLVVKIGTLADLRDEYQAHQKYIPLHKSFFVPIFQATSLIKEREAIESEELQAVAYQHAYDWGVRAKAHSPGPETLEDVVRQIILKPGRSENVAEIIWALLRGIAEAFHTRGFEPGKSSAARRLWYDMLDADLCVRAHDLQLRPGVGRNNAYPFCEEVKLLAAGELHPPGELRAQQLIRLEELTVERLSESAGIPWILAVKKGVMATIKILPPVPPNDADFRAKWQNLERGARIYVNGAIEWTRTCHQKESLEHRLEAHDLEFEFTTGMDAPIKPSVVLDPFSQVKTVLDSKRPRDKSLVHGDLNARNVLLVGEDAMLIDYSHVQKGRPSFLDFVTLEAWLMRFCLPEDFSWSQLLLLQRHLADAMLEPDRSASAVWEGLPDAVGNTKELLRAFQILWAVRAASKDIFDNYHKEQTPKPEWRTDYLEQLFLQSHVNLKYDLREPAKGEEPKKKAKQLQATAAIAGVALEAITAPEKPLLDHSRPHPPRPRESDPSSNYCQFGEPTNLESAYKPAKLSETSDNDVSDLWYVPMTLTRHSRDAFGKARNAIKDFAKVNQPEFSEFSIWSMLGSSEILVRFRSEKEEAWKLKEAMRNSLKKVVRPARYDELDKHISLFEVQREYVWSSANEANGSAMRIGIMDYPQNSPRSTTAFILVPRVVKKDPGVFREPFDALMKELEPFRNVVRGFSVLRKKEKNKITSSGQIMIELHLPCGRFEQLCRLSKRLDEVGGSFLKQTLIVYHWDYQHPSLEDSNGSANRPNGPISITTRT